jgi:hypothetical protein
MSGRTVGLSLSLRYWQKHCTVIVKTREQRVSCCCRRSGLQRRGQHSSAGDEAGSDTFKALAASAGPQKICDCPCIRVLCDETREFVGAVEKVV